MIENYENIEGVLDPTTWLAVTQRFNDNVHKIF